MIQEIEWCEHATIGDPFLDGAAIQAGVTRAWNWCIIKAIRITLLMIDQAGRDPQGLSLQGAVAWWWYLRDMDQSAGALGEVSVADALSVPAARYNPLNAL